MTWYLAKLVYRIVCGNGDHTPQFDEQLRTIKAETVTEAFEKATAIGLREEDAFRNQRHEWVQWRFVNVPELYRLSPMLDGAEIYSRVTEADDGDAYAQEVHNRAACVRENFWQPQPHLF